MPVTGIDHLYIETHNWGKSVAYWQELGFTLSYDTGHHSGQLVPPTPGPYLFLAEVGDDKEPEVHVYLGVVDGDGLSPGEPVEVVSGFSDTHWGTRVMRTHDPDGRTVNLEERTR